MITMFREAYVTSKDKVRVFYKYKKRKGPWLIFLHGGTGSMSAWFQQESFFSKRHFSMAFIDFRGHGMSDRGRSRDFFKISNFSADVNAVMKALGVSKAVIIGHCFGSFVAQDFAFRYQRKVDKLVLISSSSKPVRNFLTTVILKLYLTVIALFPLPGIRAHPDYSRFIGCWDFNPVKIINDLKHCVTDTYKNVILDSISFKSPIKKGFGKPVLLIHGVYDPLVNYRHSLELQHVFPNSIVKLLRTNHVPLLNDPSSLNIEIDGFLQNAR